VDQPLFPLPLGRRLIYHGSEDGEPETVITDVPATARPSSVPGRRRPDRVFLRELREDLRLVRAGRGRKRLVLRRGHQGVQNGKVVSTAKPFEAGKNRAKAGIIMRAHPKVGQVTPQEFAPGVAEDKARVVSLDVTVSVPFGTFHHCLKDEEFTALEPDALENKFYCPRVGIVRERDVRGGTVRTALTKIVQR
jgi:hypothetical protein